MDAVDEPVAYSEKQLDRAVVAQDQIRTVIQTFRDKLFTELFPGRTTVPKTLVFAKDDSHADDIVQTVREVFGKGNKFATKITYRTRDGKPEISFSLPQLDVSADRGDCRHDRDGNGCETTRMSAVHAISQEPDYFEQMLGRGVRIINETEFQAVMTTRSARTDLSSWTQSGHGYDLAETIQPLERKPSQGLDALFKAVAFGNKDRDRIIGRWPAGAPRQAADQG